VKMLEPKEFYTTRELAQKLRVTEMTIYRMVKRGQLPCIDFGRLKRFSKRDVLDFLSRFKKGSSDLVAAGKKTKEDHLWLDSDLSNLGEYGSYEWSPGELENGKPMRFVPGKGFLIEL